MLAKQYRVGRPCEVDTGDYRAADCGVIYPMCPNLYLEGTSDWGGAINKYYRLLAKPLRPLQGKPSHNPYQCDSGFYFFHP